MPISAFSTDYTGRNIDLNISQNINPRVSDIAQKVTYNFGQPSSCVTGVQKLVQRYLISLFNTTFLQQIYSSVSGNLQNATNIFNLTSFSVIQAFRAYQLATPNIPTDEQISTVTLVNATTNADQVTFNLQLVTQAGTNVTFILPVPLS